MSGFAEVRFKGARKGYYATAGLDLTAGDRVIVQAERGEDFGEVTALGLIAERKCSTSDCATPAPTMCVLRRAGPDEVRRASYRPDDDRRALAEARRQVAEHGLKMKVTDAEWQFDRRKLIIYFTADRRVQFRELVRDLARSFRTRIELKQIGVRDEAALLGGVGRCGRELCCATWLPELKSISLQLAKDQSLSLNPAQIAGCCGRLMCCLRYEHDSYVEARRRFPREGRVLKTGRGSETVVGVNIFRDSMTLRAEDGQVRVVGTDELKREMRARREERAGSEKQAGAGGEA